MRKGGHVNQSDCLFCHIIQGAIPCALVYEDAQVKAFLDIGPVAPGHTLIVPREHYATLFDVPSPLGADIFAAVQKVGSALMRVTGAEGINVLQNNFAAAGQQVFHVHWHLIPRFAADGITLWPQSCYPSPEAMQELALSLKNAL